MNRPVNFQQLAARDPAIALLVGAMSGVNFGHEAPPPGPQYSSANPLGAPVPEYAQFGNDMGFGSGVSAYDPSMNIGFGAHHPAHPHHAAHGHPHAHHMDATAARTLLLDPNRGSTVKVERYSFSFSPDDPLVLGTASALGTFTEQPSASIRGQRVVMNSPQEGFVTMTALQIANVNVFIGGIEDAFTYSARSNGVMLDLPRLDTQNRATASGDYSGFLPPGFTATADFPFIVTLQGPATLAGGYGQ